MSSKVSRWQFLCVFEWKKYLQLVFHGIEVYARWDLYFPVFRLVGTVFFYWGRSVLHTELQKIIYWLPFLLLLLLVLSLLTLLLSITICCLYYNFIDFSIIVMWSSLQSCISWAMKFDLSFIWFDLAFAWDLCVVSVLTWQSPSAVWENTEGLQKDRGHPLCLTLMLLFLLWYCRLFSRSLSPVLALLLSLSVSDRCIKNM